MIVIGLLVLVFGSLVGSFLNVCIYRMPKNESIVLPASHCPNCKKNIEWYDNIPVLSFLALAGKCRSCKAPISYRYPLVEALTAILLTALFFGFGITPKFFAYSILTCGLVVATFVDFEIQEIPDEISVGGIVVGLIVAFIFPSILGEAAHLRGLLNSLIGMVVGGGSILILKTFGTIVFNKKVKELGIGSAMGDGDIKLMAMVGAFIGAKLALFTFFIAPFFGVLPGLILMRKGKETIPYGPFLSLAAIVSIFFGNRILSIFFGGLF